MERSSYYYSYDPMNGYRLGLEGDPLEYRPTKKETFEFLYKGEWYPLNNKAVEEKLRFIMYNEASKGHKLNR
jgi:hypothetical protein